MAKIVHAILVDPELRKISVVEIGVDNFQSAYDLIGCEMIECAYRFPNGDALYVDEEALVKANRPVGLFKFQGHGPFLGKGLIVNDIEITGEGNEWTAPHGAFVALVQSVKFVEG